MAALRVKGLALRLTDWCQDKWTSRTGNLPRKRRDITAKLLKAVLNANHSLHIVCKLTLYCIHHATVPFTLIITPVTDV